MGEEAPIDDNALDAAAAELRTDRLIEAAREPTGAVAPTDPAEATGTGATGTEATGGDRPRVAVARDAAFRFIYPATVERLRERATVETFEPTAGDPLPSCDGVYLPGGYPELHAEAIAGSPALDDIADAAADGVPVLGECGGLMALAESLTTVDGDTHAMAGVLPADVTMRDRYQALDHVELRAKRDGPTASTGSTAPTAPTAAAGTTLRGHEFHYSAAEVASDARFAFDVVRGTGIDGDHDGLIEHRTVGTYAHVHPASGAFDAFCDGL
jgi:cobyrinic acid a,c-diamide synthase